MSRSTLKCGFLLILVTGLFYWRTLLTKQFTMILGPETVNYTYSWLRFWVDSLRHGHVPLWDPYAFCGRPFAGEMLPSAFYPLHLPLLLFPFDKDGLLPQRLYHALRIFSHLLGAWFTFALIREFRLSRFPAFVGACAFAFSTMLVNMLWPPFVEAAIWLPIVLLFLVRALRAEGAFKAVVNASLSGLCLGMSILTGGLQFSMMQGIVIVTAVVYYTAGSPLSPALSRWSSWQRAALILTTIVAVAAGIGAVQLVAAAEYGKLTLRSIDGGLIPAMQKIPYHRLHPGLLPQAIVSVLLPFGFRGAIGTGEHWASYVGVFPLLLAVTALWKRWREVWVRYLAGLFLFAFLYSLSEFSPVHGILYAVVPLLWVIRGASRFAYLGTFALAILAAFGLESLLATPPGDAAWNDARRILKWVAIACCAALFVPAVFVQLNLDVWNCLSLLLILGSCGWFAYLTRHGATPWARVLLAAFILFDLRAFEWLELAKDAPNKPEQELQQLISLRNAAGFLKSQPELGRVRVAVHPEPNIGDAYGVHGVWGGGGTLLKNYPRLMKREDLLNVRYIVKPVSVTEPGPIYQDARWKVYRNPKAFARAWVVHEVLVEKSQEQAFRRIEDPSIDLHGLAVLDRPLPGALDKSSGPEEVPRFRSYQGERIQIDVTAGSKGLLVLSEMHYPGWRAFVNGKAAEVHRVNGGLRGIVIPRGQDHVVFEYAPLKLRIAAAVTLLTCLAVLAGLVASWRKFSLAVNYFCSSRLNSRARVAGSFRL